jgi:hypothetical protein
MYDPKRKPEISPEIVWPVLAYDESDPEFRINAEDPLDLGRYIEFWNSGYHPDDNSVVMFDAKGRELGGEIDLLQVVNSGPLLNFAMRHASQPLKPRSPS